MNAEQKSPNQSFAKTLQRDNWVTAEELEELAEALSEEVLDQPRVCRIQSLIAKKLFAKSRPKNRQKAERQTTTTRRRSRAATRGAK